MIYDEIPSHCDVTYPIRFDIDVGLFTNKRFHWLLLNLHYAIMQTDSNDLLDLEFLLNQNILYWIFCDPPQSIFWNVWFVYLSCELSLFTFHKNEWRNQFNEYGTDSYDCLIIIIVLTAVKNVRIYVKSTQHFDICIRLCLAQWSQMPVQIWRQQQSVRLVLHKKGPLYITSIVNNRRMNIRMNANNRNKRK